jgi:integrase
VRFKGKLHRQKLDTDVLPLAKRKLRKFKDDLERTDATKGNTSFAAVLDDYTKTLGGSLETRKKKRIVVEKLRQTWFGIDSLPLRTVKPSQVAAWLAKHYEERSASHYNAALTVIRDALDIAMRNKIILESPAKDLTYRKRKQPIRPAPTFERFKQIVADIRAQRFNREAQQTGDFVEFLGLGLGQAEVAGIKRSDVDLDVGRIIVYRC